MQLITLLNTHTHTNNSLCLKMCMWRNAGKKVYYICIMGVWSLCICVVFWGMHAVFLGGGVGLAYMLAWHTKQMKVWIWFCCCMPFFFLLSLFCLLSTQSSLICFSLSFWSCSTFGPFFWSFPLNEWINLIVCWMGLSYEDYFGS